MGDFVQEPENPAFEWGIPRYSVDDETTKALVAAKYEATMATADEMLTRLVGSGGNGGYLGLLNSAIVSFGVPNITAENITVPSTSVVWDEGEYDSGVLAALLARILNDLTIGATGLDPIVEQEIYDRALARQAIENDRVQREIEDYFSTRGFDLPTGAMAGRLQEQANEISRNNLELNGKIMIEQADLAQKNSQFIIDAAVRLEGILRSLYDGINNRALQYAQVASHIALEETKYRLANAELQLKALISKAEIELGAYTSEYSLREKVATSEANIAMQAVASAYGSVNMSAGLTYSSGMQHSESTNHSESRSDGTDRQASLSESHMFEEEAGVEE
jgi:hypothetical protein